jgi:peptidoglycan-N-acetylglucosamine deacetylase
MHKHRNIRLALVVVILTALLCSVFYSTNKINRKKSRINNVINKPKDTLTPPVDKSMNLRESKIESTEANVDITNVDVYKSDGYKIAYLTFDDGPSATITPKVLKILHEYNIKATFFIIGSRAEEFPNLLKKEAIEGQSIANHTYSHNLKYIYSNTNAFISDVNRCDTILKLILGSDFNSRLVRFPGGSFGKKLKPYREAIKNQGYHYIDWNDLTGDAESTNISVDKLMKNIEKYTIGKEHVVILMHDASGKTTTVKALPKVIEYLKSQGYSFKTLK